MKAEEMLERYETFVKVSQPHNTTPIFLKENVLEVMKEYAKLKCKEQRDICAKINRCEGYCEQCNDERKDIINAPEPTFD